jgi:hypothetical protein
MNESFKHCEHLLGMIGLTKFQIDNSYFSYQNKPLVDGGIRVEMIDDKDMVASIWCPKAGISIAACLAVNAVTWALRADQCIKEKKTWKEICEQYKN